ncbi:MAG TPA: hypothetical protein VFG30_23810 [Polyangiales bacterium]|nr:hypothetical protein [Polyangiales bacterium]
MFRTMAAEIRGDALEVKVGTSARRARATRDLHSHHQLSYASLTMRVFRVHDLMLGVCFVVFSWAIFAANASAAESDALGPDKALHYTVSVGLTLGASLVLDVVGLDEPVVLPLSIGFALGMGVGKELFDAVRGSAFSAADLTWDVLGIATGVLIRVLLRAIFEPDRVRADASQPRAGYFFFVVK